MAGFLRKKEEDQEPDIGASKEEAWLSLFPKAGRDFVYREDFYRIMEQILAAIDPDGSLGIDVRSDSAARERALAYKETLESGADGRDFYEDLIDLDDSL